MKIGLMSRLTSLRAAPARAEKWHWDEEMKPHGAEPGRRPLAWPRAALLIGLLSLALWVVIALLIIHFTR